MFFFCKFLFSWNMMFSFKKLFLKGIVFFKGLKCYISLPINWKHVNVSNSKTPAICRFREIFLVCFQLGCLRITFVIFSSLNYRISTFLLSPTLHCNKANTIICCHCCHIWISCSCVYNYLLLLLGYAACVTFRITTPLYVAQSPSVTVKLVLSIVKYTIVSVCRLSWLLFLHYLCN